MTANTIIYRYTDPGDAYNSPGFADLVQLDFGVIPTPSPPASPTFSNPDETGHLGQQDIEALISLQPNPKPNQNVPHDLQDMGISYISWTLTGFCELPAVTTVPKVILSWLSDFRYNATYPFGRFGITSLDFPQLNGKPTAAAGYMLEYVKMTRNGRFPKLDLILRLKWNGPLTTLGTPGP